MPIIASKKILALPVVTDVGVAGSDAAPLVAAGVTSKMTFDNWTNVFRRLLGQNIPGIPITFSASMTPDMSYGTESTITVASGVAFTLNAPLNPVFNKRLVLEFRNVSGGAMGVATFNAVFKMPAFVAPANGFNRT